MLGILSRRPLFFLAEKMLFEDISCLNELIRLIRTDPQPYGKANGRFRDLQVRRLFLLRFIFCLCRMLRLISSTAHRHLRQILLEHLN
jgi:hypothetical protein